MELILSIHVDKTNDMTPATRKTKSQRTRDTILTAARAIFADQGYAGTTLRDVGARAGVDPALVVRYFGGKDGLFAQATEIDLAIPDLAQVERGDLGHAIARHFLSIWEEPRIGVTLTILLRTAASDQAAAARVRQIFAAQVLPALAGAVPQAELAERAGLISSHLLGVALTRYVLRLPPVAAMDKAALAEALAPALQYHATGDLPGAR